MATIYHETFLPRGSTRHKQQLVLAACMQPPWGIVSNGHPPAGWGSALLGLLCCRWPAPLTLTATRCRSWGGLSSAQRPNALCPCQSGRHSASVCVPVPQRPVLKQVNAHQPPRPGSLIRSPRTWLRLRGPRFVPEATARTTHPASSTSALPPLEWKSFRGPCCACERHGRWSPERSQSRTAPAGQAYVRKN